MSHAEKSPSASARWSACPGSIRYIQTLPPALQNPTNPEADKGTAAHFLLETCLKAPAEPSDFLGRKIVVAEGKETRFAQRVGKNDQAFEVTADMVRNVKVAVDYVNAKKAEGFKVYVERKVNPLPDRDDTYGKSDVILDGWPILESLDYKNGRKFVPASSSQIAAYLGGSMEWVGRGYETYKATVIQPNSKGEPVRSQDYTEAELVDFLELYRASAGKVDVATYEFDMFPLAEWQRRYLSAGDHCGFCPCAGICPERFRATVAEVSADVPEDSQWLPNMKEIKDAEYAVRLLRHADQIKSHLEKAEEFLKAALADPEIQIPGVALENGRGRNAWLAGLSEAQIVKLCAPYGLDKKQLYKTKMITGPQAADLVPAEQYDAFKAEMLNYTPGALKVVLK